VGVNDYEDRVTAPYHLYGLVSAKKKEFLVGTEGSEIDGDHLLRFIVLKLPDVENLDQDVFFPRFFGSRLCGGTLIFSFLFRVCHDGVF